MIEFLVNNNNYGGFTHDEFACYYPRKTPHCHYHFGTTITHVRSNS